MTPRLASAWILPLAALASLASSACNSQAKRDAKLGDAIFRDRCALCHATGGETGRGPGLARIVGRKAATAPGFGFSPALRASGLRWDEPTLDRFLTAPSTLVPGTTMPIAVPSAEDRRVLLAFLRTLDGTNASPPHATSSPGPSGPSPGDFSADAPGRRHHVTFADLPAPYATPSAENGPDVVDRPASAMPRVPAGFTVDLFASHLANPRTIRVAPNGDAFIAETAIGQIRVLRAKDGAKTPDAIEVFATALDRPFGIAFFPPGPDPQWVYVANTGSVVRFPYRSGDLHARGPREILVPSLGSDGGHSTRDVAFSKDGARMFVSVGSGSNVAQSLPRRSPDEIRAWEQAHGLGASWGDEEGRADVLVFTPDGKNEQTFATGLRNCVGLAVAPETGDVWCSVNERDGLGDDLVPDYATRVHAGAFYGWPWFYLGDHEDPRHAGERTDLSAKVTVPDVLFQAHSAPLGTAFYEAEMFPADYRGNLFVAFHGSWNRATRTGPKVVRVLATNGVPTGEYEEFMTGFVADEGHVWGRPVGVAVAHDGALLVTEDANGTVWRVSR